MGKIILDVNDKNIDIVITILDNLKNGLIDKIEYDTSTTSKKPMPKAGGKYLSTSAYKQRLKSLKNS